ncbi:DUF2510 domain-containing protein [Kitasatospora sp. NPDC101183]|uniref:DUF2510 domain-containing protein n=1 Tax=Kitasatospora sp. NPDC101183 TaxID=3364100 RepID=UPI00380AC7B4
MSNSTPPGWYPVPGADGTPGHERWWDGHAWTEQVRPLPHGGAGIADAATQPWQPPDGRPASQPAPPPPAAPPAAPSVPPRPGYGYGAPQDAGYGYPGATTPGYGYPGQETPGAAGYGYPGPGYPGPGYRPQGPRRVRPGLVAGITAAVVTIGALTAYILIGGPDGTPDSGPTPDPVVTSRTLPPRPAPTTSTVAPPKPLPTVKSTVPDTQHSITVPVLDGWDAATNSAHSTVYLGSGRYTCPTGGACIRGQFSVEKDAIQGLTAKAAADAAMPVYAGQIFTGITTHTDSGSGTVTVAGVLGYATRWHIRTSDGTQGYVLLAAVPAKGGGFVVFEGGVDDDPQAPDPTALDQILKGIRQDGSASGTV